MSAPTDPTGESVALEALLLARARLYALFHKLFGAAPDAAVLEALLGGATADAVDEYAEDDETMRGFGRFLSELAAVEGRAALLEAARDEYVRLLVGPGALPAIPWEAPYRTGEPTVFQEGTLAVRRVSGARRAAEEVAARPRRPRGARMRVHGARGAALARAADRV